MNARLAMGLVVAGSGLTGCNRQPSTPRAEPRDFVIAAFQGTQHHVVTRRSLDGSVWTDEEFVKGGDAANPTFADTRVAPGLTFDGTMFHLAWVDLSGHLRYATSRDGDAWAIADTPLSPGVLHPGPFEGVEVAAAGGRIGVAVAEGGRALAFEATDDGPSSGQASVVEASPASNPSIAGLGQDLFLAVVTQGSPRRARILRSPRAHVWEPLPDLPVADPEAVRLAVHQGVLHVVVRTRPPAAALRSRILLLNSADARQWVEIARADSPGRSFDPLTIFSDKRQVRFGELVNLNLALTSSASLARVAVLTSGTDTPGFSAVAARAPGNGICELRLLNTEVVQETEAGGDEIVPVVVGFRVRMPVPNSARVSAASRSPFPIAEDVGTGRTVPVEGTLGGVAVRHFIKEVGEGRDNFSDTAARSTPQTDVLVWNLQMSERDGCPNQCFHRVLQGTLGEVPAIVNRRMAPHQPSVLIEDAVGMTERAGRQTIAQLIEQDLEQAQAAAKARLANLGGLLTCAAGCELLPSADAELNMARLAVVGAHDLPRETADTFKYVRGLTRDVDIESRLPAGPVGGVMEWLLSRLAGPVPSPAPGPTPNWRTRARLTCS